MKHLLKARFAYPRGLLAKGVARPSREGVLVISALR
jgi:hypothetical protein